MHPLPNSRWCFVHIVLALRALFFPADPFLRLGKAFVMLLGPRLADGYTGVLADGYTGVLVHMPARKLSPRRARKYHISLFTNNTADGVRHMMACLKAAYECPISMYVRSRSATVPCALTLIVVYISCLWGLSGIGTACCQPS